MTISMRLELTVFIFNYKYPSSDITVIFMEQHIWERSRFSRFVFFSLLVNGILYSFDEKNHCFLLTEWTIDGECNFICS